MKRDVVRDIAWCAAFVDAYNFVAPKYGMEGIEV